MATSKQYAYYLEGNKIAIVEKDVSFDNDIASKDYGPGASRQRWESPQSTVADGLKVKYVYAPTYTLTNNTSSTVVADVYYNNGGYLSIYDNAAVAVDLVDTYSLAVGDYILLENAGKWNGIHKIKTISNYRAVDADADNNQLTFETKAIGVSTTGTTFEETVTFYPYITALEDESFELDLPLYLQKALVYYIRAKLAEDGGNLKLREYAMKEFKKMIEKHENSRISGLRITSSGSHAIR